mmetsp:Transcript_65647/g.189260  ORF Transcript_65647/g.189260 Transcript_65647/m.189260 type:complete len:221 (+) Transcript_65647:299-961(+)
MGGFATAAAASTPSTPTGVGESPVAPEDNPFTASVLVPRLTSAGLSAAFTAEAPVAEDTDSIPAALPSRAFDVSFSASPSMAFVVSSSGSSSTTSVVHSPLWHRVTISVRWRRPFSSAIPVVRRTPSISSIEVGQCGKPPKTNGGSMSPRTNGCSKNEEKSESAQNLGRGRLCTRIPTCWSGSVVLRSVHLPFRHSRMTVSKCAAGPSPTRDVSVSTVCS